MATYEYYCPVCESTKTVTRSIHEDELNVYCDVCKNAGRKVIISRQYSAPAITFKGTGWGKDA
jgi:putative FmdB family regulatory protein